MPGHGFFSCWLFFEIATRLFQVVLRRAGSHFVSFKSGTTSPSIKWTTTPRKNCEQAHG